MQMKIYTMHKKKHYFRKENRSGPRSSWPWPPLQRSGPTISGPDTRTSLCGPVRTQVREGQDRTADSLSAPPSISASSIAISLGAGVTPVSRSPFVSFVDLPVNLPLPLLFQARSSSTSFSLSSQSTSTLLNATRPSIRLLRLTNCDRWCWNLTSCGKNHDGPMNVDKNSARHYEPPTLLTCHVFIILDLKPSRVPPLISSSPLRYPSALLSPWLSPVFSLDKYRR